MRIETVVSTQKHARKHTNAPGAQELLGQLDGVEVRLLLWLLHYPFQRAVDLSLAAGISIATAYRHLGMVYNAGLIEHVMPPVLGTGTCRLYHLSNLGLQVLAAHEQVEAAELARAWSTDERGLLRLLPRLSSLVTLQECINGLVLNAPEALAYTGHRPEVRWHWVRDYTHCFLYREKLVRFTADAALLLRVRSKTEDGKSAQEQWYSLFVLLDADIADAGWLKQRLGRLLCFRESAERWPVYQHYPPLLVLVSTPRRREWWQRSALEASATLQAAPLAGAVACVPDTDQSAPFNPWRLSWKTLATLVPCKIQHLLQPLPMEAIPPDLWEPHVTNTLGPEVMPANDAAPQSTLSRKRDRIIVGHYMDRAKAAPGGRVNDGHNEQEERALLGLCLGRRHLELLALIFTYPLLHSREIAALIDLEVSSIERYLGTLYKKGCVVPIGTSRVQHWRLSERGLRFIAAKQHVHIQRIATLEECDKGTMLVQKGLDDLLRHVEHTSGIYGFFASLAQAATKERTQGHDHRLLWWETGSACEHRYRDHDRWHNLRPDAFAEYQVGERRVRFWLEWDRGTMSTADLATKCTTYARYVASREWFKQEATMPFLLVVTPDPGQERRFGRVARATLTDECGLIIRTTTLTRMHEQGLLGPIWNQVLPHGGGNDLMPRRTFDL
jgi:DNA-binding MarR family transcriptional regulator